MRKLLNPGRNSAAPVKSRLLTFRSAFAVLLVLNTCALVAALSLYIVARRQAGIGAQLAPVEAFARDGRPVRLAAAKDCRVVRYESESCAFCRLDSRGNWARLRTAALTRGCQILHLQPTLSEGGLPEDPTGGSEVHIRAVSPRFAVDSGLQATPTVLVLDRTSKVVWRHVGVLSGSDLRAAIRSLP